MRRPQRTRLALVIAAVAWVAVACGGGTEGSSTTGGNASTTAEAEEAVTEMETAVVITVTSLSFPDQVSIPAGKSVTWVNDSSAPHEVQMDTFDGAQVDMEAVRLPVDQEASLDLDIGTWTYFCTIHPAMTGSLVVEG